MLRHCYYQHEAAQWISTQCVYVSVCVCLIRPGASAQNMYILSGTRERIGVFKVSVNIGSHFKDCHKNIHKKVNLN